MGSTQLVNGSKKRLARFGVFELDLDAGELRKQGVRLQLQPKPLQMLALLLERPGEIVTREELRRRLWDDDTFVDYEGGLNTAANRLRLKLGGRHSPIHRNDGAQRIPLHRSGRENRLGAAVSYHCTIHSRMKGKMAVDPPAGQ
jgi:hypothetical protein